MQQHFNLQNFTLLNFPSEKRQGNLTVCIITTFLICLKTAVLHGRWADFNLLNVIEVTFWSFSVFLSGMHIQFREGQSLCSLSNLFRFHISFVYLDCSSNCFPVPCFTPSKIKPLVQEVAVKKPSTVKICAWSFVTVPSSRSKALTPQAPILCRSH